MSPQIAHEAQPELRIPANENEARWNTGTRIAFRFVFAYLLLYNFSAMLSWLTYAPTPAEKYEELWHKVVPWVGEHVLRLSAPITIFSNGSGDTTYDYVCALCFLWLAAAATVVWSLADRKRLNYEKLHRWLRLYVRLTLAGTMVSYGAFKVIKSQFPDLSLSRLLQPYGDSSPMGLLWTFMGASTAYTVFAGAVEMLGGLLLILPRLTTLGALVSVIAMGNIFVLNMCYDVPVKLYSLHLLLMGVFLLVPDGRRLFNLFVLNREAEPAADQALFVGKWRNRGVLAFQLAFGVYVTVLSLHQSYRAYQQYNVKPPFYGIWAVDEFSVDGAPKPDSLDDETRWHRAVFATGFDFSVQSLSGARVRFMPEVDSKKKTLTLHKRGDQKQAWVLTFQQPGPESLTLDGQLDGRRIQAKLRHLEDPKFLLTTRGFHWINEYPFNR